MDEERGLTRDRWDKVGQTCGHEEGGKRPTHLIWDKRRNGDIAVRLEDGNAIGAARDIAGQIVIRQDDQERAYHIPPRTVRNQYTTPHPHIYTHLTTPPHRIVLSTNSLSNLPTSPLNASISFQQSSGLRSFVLKHATTASFALPTCASTCSSFFLAASFARSCSTSFVTLSRLMSFWRCFSARVDLEDVASASLLRREGESESEEGSEDRVSL
jgi:hypothetical protein